MSTENSSHLVSVSRPKEDVEAASGVAMSPGLYSSTPAVPLPSPAAVEFDVSVEGEHDEASLLELDLASNNLGDGNGCCPCGIRQLVSKKKKRFISPAEGVDLDLSYITNRVIAMGYPSVGIEALYRNPSDKVRTFLETRHGGKYRLYNLCCEREYKVTELFGKGVEVERFAWADHTPPPAAMVLPAMESMDSWLAANSENVVVIHCKAGKGRTGTIIAAYLVHTRVARSADEAMEMFGWRRTTNGKGVTIPSQARFVRQYSFQQAALAHFAGYYSASAAGSRLSGGQSKTTPAASSAADGASGASSFHRPATAVIVRSDPGGEGGFDDRTTVLTVRLERDSDRGPGFTLAAVPLEGDASPAAAAKSPSKASKGAGKSKDKVLGDHIRVEISAVDGAFSHGSHPTSSNNAASPSASVADASNSVLPVPVSGVLRAGDHLLSVNGIELSGRSFPEVVSIVRSAADPLTIKVARTHARPSFATPASPSGAASAVAGSPVAAADGASRGNRIAAAMTTESAAGGAHILAALSPEQYLSRVATAIGPWAGPLSGNAAANGTSNPRAVPSPPVEICGVYLSHVPRLKTKGDASGNVRSAWLCGASKHPGQEDGPGLYLQLFAGPGCRTLVWDSRYGPVTNAASASVGAGRRGGATPVAPAFPAASAVNHSDAGAEPAHELAAGSDYFSPTPARATAGGSIAERGAAKGASSLGDVELTSAPPVVTDAPAGPGGVRIAGEVMLHQPLSTIGVAWEGERFFPHAAHGAGAAAPVTAAGDFRLVFCIVGRKKPFAAMWLNTAFFPVPHAAVPAVRDAMVKAHSLSALPASISSSAGPTPVHSPSAAAAGVSVAEASASAAADHYRTKLNLSPADGLSPTVPALRLPVSTATSTSARSTGSSNGPLPGTATRALTVAIPSSPALAPDAPVSPAVLARLPPGTTLPARGTIPSTDASREVLSKTIWLGPDVPGCVIGPSVPLLGALYTASGTHEPHLPIPVPEATAAASASASADAVVIFRKRHIDGANKDKKHKAFPSTFTIALRFKALGLPPEYASVLASAGATGIAAPPS